MIQVESSCRGVQGHLPRKAKNKLEAQFQCGCLNSFLPAARDCKHRSSGFPSEAMLWIKEVELLWTGENPRDQFMERIFKNLTCWMRELLLLCKIIQNSHFKKKVSLEEQKAQKEDWFPRERQIAFMIYDYFRVTGAHDTVLDYADFFSVTLRDDNEFDTKWDEVLPPLSKIAPDDILESLYKLRIRESAQLKTVLEWYDMVIHQTMPDYQN